MKRTHLSLAFLILAAGASPAQRPPSAPERGRDLGIPFEGTTGPLNAITDVTGVEVGHRTLVAGGGKLVGGEGPAPPGGPAAFPPGQDSAGPPVAGRWPPQG